MTETVLAPTPALLVAPRAVRLVNPRLTQLAEMALFDEPLASAPSPSASPSTSPSHVYYTLKSSHSA